MNNKIRLGTEKDIDSLVQLYEDVLIISIFVVNSKKLQQGIGKRMLEFAAQFGTDTKVKALRLAVYEDNTPAIRLYERCGYHYIDTVVLG